MSETITAGAQLGNKNAAGPHKVGTKVWVGNSIGNIEDHDSTSNEYLVSVSKKDAHGVFRQGTKVHHTIKHADIHVAPSQFQDKASATSASSDEVVRAETITAGAKPGNKNAAGPHRTAMDIHAFSQSLPHYVFEDADAHKEAIYDHFHQDEHFKPALEVLSKMNMKVGRIAKELMNAADSSDTDAIQAGAPVGNQDLMNETITAAGSSEGVKKSWDSRRRKEVFDEAEGRTKIANEFDSKPNNFWENTLAHHTSAESAHMAAAALADDDKVDSHLKQALHHRRKANEIRSHVDSEQKKGVHWSKIVTSPTSSVHDKANKDYQDSHSGKGPMALPSYKSSEASFEADVIHCRSHSAAGSVLAADKPWSPGEQVQFMWMPAGVHTICAGFRKGSIQLTVNCDQNTAAAVQASLEEWRNERPKQEPFGCIEHKEQEASFRVGASCGFQWNQDGVYLAAEPTTLGAQNVNGKIHRSWSPSFTTDADYSKATEKNGMLLFPEGVRGSRSNPAQITGVDFCVGTLTNKPAFHAMSPVKASEETVQAPAMEVRGDADEPITLAVIAARHQSALEAAEAIAASQGAVESKPTMADLEAKFSTEPVAGESAEQILERIYARAGVVTATGTSDGAKKGWESRFYVKKKPNASNPAFSQFHVIDKDTGAMIHSAYDKREADYRAGELNEHHNKGTLGR